MNEATTTFPFPEEIAHLSECSKDFEDMMSMEYDWDGEGSDPPPTDNVIPAFEWFKRMAVHMRENKQVLRAPYFTLRKDGTVDFFWDKPIKLLMNICPNKDGSGPLVASYYAKESALYDFEEVVSLDTIGGYLSACLKKVSDPA